MKQIICFSFFMLCFCGLSLGQSNKFNYTVSKPYQVIDGAQKYYCSKRTDKTLSVKIDGKDIYMQSFDSKAMKEIKREKFSDMPKGYVLEEIAWFKDRLYFYYSLWDKPNETEQLFAREIDFENCKFKGEGKRIIANEGKLMGSPMFSAGLGGFSLRIGSTPKFDFLYSKDETKMLIQCRKRVEKKSDAINYDKIGLFVFGEGLVEIAKNEVKMPYTEKQMDNVDYSIDSDGIPYILARVRPDASDKDIKRKDGAKVVNYHIELLRIDVAKANIKISKINLSENYIKDIWLYEGLNNSMLCSGFYNKASGRDLDANADGVFLFNINKDGEVDNKKFYEIPVEILNQYIKSDEQKKNEKKDKDSKADFTNLVLRDLIVQDDNSIIIIGEQYYYTVYYDSKGRAHYTYYYNDMLMTKISPDGKLSWMRKLPKRQKGSAPRGGMGFQHMVIGDNHYVVFLDNIKNLELSLDKRPALHMDGRGGFLTAYRINDESGKVSKVSIFDTKELPEGYELYQFNTGRMIPVSENEFVVEFYIKKKQDIMIKVKVE